jgi:hypothetical protein
VSPNVKHGLIETLSTSTVMLSSGGVATILLTVNSIGSTPLGSYTVTLTGTSGSQAVTLQIPITVTAKK